jgi:hypothetical protein
METKQETNEGLGIESVPPDDDFARWAAEKKRQHSGHRVPEDIKPGTLREFGYLCRDTSRTPE